MPTIEYIKEVVSELGEKYGAESIYLFGSFARGEQNEKSDLDFRINKGKIQGIQIGGLYSDLEERFNMPIDLVTTGSLDEKFLNHIAKEEILLYARNWKR